jgi:hypothetical protein
MSKHFYGISCIYGPDCVDGDGKRLGTVRVFNSKKKRDEWVGSERWDGRIYHRAAITSDEARGCMIDSYFMDWDALDKRYHIAPDEVRYATMDQIVACYESRLKEYEDDLALITP